MIISNFLLIFLKENSLKFYKNLQICRDLNFQHLKRTPILPLISWNNNAPEGGTPEIFSKNVWNSKAILILFSFKEMQFY